MTLGLPAAIRACLFDLDGVITDTTSLHAAAWKEAFDTLLQQHEGEGFRPFAADTGYDEFFDGRSSAEGVRCFLSSRGIQRPDGSPDDPPGPDTVYGLVRWKNSLFEERTRSQGAQVHQDTMAYVMAARDSGLLTAVVTSSANCREILRAARMETLFDAWIDGVVAASRNLRGKPHPDTFLAAARDLGQHPAQCAVFENAQAGMDAGRSGHFGWVVGVARTVRAGALYAHGADVVVKDLGDLTGTPDPRPRP
ncbi:HAD family hydrolase [Streptomyces sp. HGB0020]|uniref:HAD family hydrolase n=1 Tax=Streptomyces sp. HGB0020 TaxID=1078086 RepID=UPI00034E8CE4|nr:HAD-IA family hydrolase [Streptomyces sp. HGB0020]EPD63541.1 beta-phosphoglucomutase family hydrolase [Streptomyces sp. HGB0020]